MRRGPQATTHPHERLTCADGICRSDVRSLEGFQQESSSDSTQSQPYVAVDGTRMTLSMTGNCQRHMILVV